MPSKSVLKARTRTNYPYLLDYRTRWSDNDMFAHMNNVVYYFLFDSIINTYLIQNCGFDPVRRVPQYGMAVHTHADFFASIAFPQIAELGLRVVELGRSSVRYEIALFAKDEPLCGVKAVGEFIQVFVDAETGRPNAMGMNAALRAGLQRIHVWLPGDGGDGGDDGGENISGRHGAPAVLASKL